MDECGGVVVEGGLVRLSLVSMHVTSVVKSRFMVVFDWLTGCSVFLVRL